MSHVKFQMSNAYGYPWDMLNNFFMFMLKSGITNVKCSQLKTSIAISEEWTRAVFLKGKGKAPTDVTDNIGEEKFNQLFAKCPVVQYTRNSKVHSVYVRKTEPKGINAFNMFTGKNQDIRIAHGLMDQN